jgi:DNA-binding transcriptional ArsR family regulator
MQDTAVDALIIEALSHPTRVLLLQILLHKPVSAVMVARAHGLDLSHVAYHFRRVLYTRLHLVEVLSRHPRRGAEEKVFALKDEYYGDVVRGLLSLKNGTTGNGAHSAWHAVAVDERGAHEIRDAVGALAETVAAARERCAQSDDPAELRQLFIGTAFFDRSQTA